MNLYSDYVIASDLVIKYDTGSPVICLPSSKVKIKTDWKVLYVLSLFKDKNKTSSFKPELSEAMINNIIKTFISKGILVTKTEDRNKYSTKLINKWKDWEDPAWFLHLNSINPKFEPTIHGRESIANIFIENSPPPPERFVCDCSPASISLPLPSELNGSTTADTFTLRRSCRSFLEEAITINELSDLLFYTGGILFTNDTGYFGKVSKKTAPSPGGRHSIELYVAINNCTGVKKGIYHYCQKDHSLNILTEEADMSSFLKDALYNQDYLTNASVVFFYTCVLERIMWKYKSSRFYRLVHYETAHYAQNFLLTGTALGLGVFVTGALKENVIGTKIGVDGTKEIVMYATGAGKRDLSGEKKDVKLSKHIPEDFNVGLPLGEHS